jgi:hypothetical protein
MRANKKAVTGCTLLQGPPINPTYTYNGSVLVFIVVDAKLLIHNSL